MVINKIIDDMMTRIEKESWQPSKEIWYKVLIMRNGYGFSQMFRQQSEDYPSGLSVEKAKAMIKKGDSLYKITAEIERIQ